MWRLLTVVLFVVGQFLAEVQAFPCDQYAAANKPMPGHHPDSYIQNNEERYCPQGQTFLATACDCVDKPATAAPGMTQPQQPQPPQFPPTQQFQQQLSAPLPQQNMVYPQQGQNQQMPGNALTQPQMPNQMPFYPQMQQMPMPNQMQMMPAQMYAMQTPGITPQQQLYLQALQQQQAALMYGQPQSSMVAWGQPSPQAAQTSTPTSAGGMGGMPNFMALGAAQGNDLARDMFYAQTLAQGMSPVQGRAPGAAGPIGPGGNLDPSLLSWAAMNGNPMASNLMTMNVLQNPQLVPLAAIYGIDQTTELAATQSLISGGMRNPAFGLMSTAFLDLPDTAGLMFAAQGASGGGVTRATPGAAATQATPADTTGSGSSNANNRGGGGGMNLDPFFLSFIMNM